MHDVVVVAREMSQDGGLVLGVAALVIIVAGGCCPGREQPAGNQRPFCRRDGDIVTCGRHFLRQSEQHLLRAAGDLVRKPEQRICDIEDAKWTSHALRLSAVSRTCRKSANALHTSAPVIGNPQDS